MRACMHTYTCLQGGDSRADFVSVRRQREKADDFTSVLHSRLRTSQPAADFSNLRCMQSEVGASSRAELTQLSNLRMQVRAGMTRRNP